MHDLHLLNNRIYECLRVPTNALLHSEHSSFHPLRFYIYTKHFGVSKDIFGRTSTPNTHWGELCTGHPLLLFSIVYYSGILYDVVY